MATKATTPKTTTATEAKPSTQAKEQPVQKAAEPTLENQPADLSLDELMAAAMARDGVLADRQKALAHATDRKIDAQRAAQAAWDAIYDRLMALREEYKTSPAFDQSKLKRLLNRADR